MSNVPIYSLLYLHCWCPPYSMYSRTMMTFTEHSTVSATCVSHVSPESREHLQHVVSSRWRRNEHTVCQQEKLQLIIQLESKHEDEQKGGGLRSVLGLGFIIMMRRQGGSTDTSTSHVSRGNFYKPIYSTFCLKFVRYFNMNNSK